MEESMSEGYFDFKNELIESLAMLLRVGDEDEMNIGGWKILFRKNRHGNIIPITMLSVSTRRRICSVLKKLPLYDE